MGINLKRTHAIVDGIHDFLGNSQDFEARGESSPIELDYQWDFSIDPIITPTIIHEWNFLNELMGNLVLKDANTVLSIGGGGTSQTHLYLGENASELFILNPGLWDLRTAKKPLGRIETTLIRAIAEELPFTDECVDAIEIPATIDHLVDPKMAINECFRVLKPGGKIGVTLGNRNSWYRQVVKILRFSFEDHHEHHHNFHLTPIEIEEMLAVVGFKHIRTVGTSYLKLPKRIERAIRTPLALRIHRKISDVILRRVFGDNRGGMFITYAVKR